MRFEVQEKAKYLREMVFATHRDRLEDIARYLPDVERVELRSRSRHATGKEQQTHLWTGSPSALPLLIRPLVPPALLQWQQVTVWDTSTWTATWTIEVPGLGAAIAANGKNVYVADGTSCRIDLDGEFSFHPERVPQLASVPTSMVPMIEKLVVGLIVPMIERTGSAVAKYLDDHAGNP